jgi:nicotinamide mononucleotide (NMN) deamidase PncC
MERLLGPARRIAGVLMERGETLAVSEGACGGLLSAGLVGVPGASRFFVAGAVLYTRRAFEEILDDRREGLRGLRGATEAFSLALARITREKYGSTWALGETGASGPAGNRYGDAAGHAALAVAGPLERSLTLETGLDNRVENMWRFAEAALALLEEALTAQAPARRSGRRAR